MGYEYARSAASEHSSASGSASGTPGKSTVTGKMAGKPTNLEDRLEALEQHVDQLDDLGAKLMANLAAPSAPTYAMAVRAKLDAGAQLAQKLRGAKTTLKRKKLYDDAHAALSRLLALETEFGQVADSILASASAPKTRPSDAFGVHEEAEPEMDPGPVKALTGSRVVDEGYFCEQEQHANDKKASCGSTVLDRREIRGELRGHVASAMHNFGMAIGNARLDALTSTEHGWGFLAEFLFFTVTGPLIARAVKGVERYQAIAKAANAVDGLDAMRGAQAVKSLVERASKEDIQAGLTNASRALRGVLKAAVSGVSDGNRNKASFLLMMQEQLKPIGDSIWGTAPAVLDDAELAALNLSYKDEDQKIHTVEAYEDHINAVTAAYAKQDVAAIGSATNGRRLRAIKLVAYGFERWATFEEDAPQTGQGGRSPFDGQLLWNGWLDDTFAGLASELYESRTGKDVQTRDVTHGYLFLQERAKEPAHWDRSLTDGMEDTLDAWREKCRRRSLGESVVDVSNPAMKRPGEGINDGQDEAATQHEDENLDDPEDLDFEYREQQGAGV